MIAGIHRVNIHRTAPPWRYPIERLRWMMACRAWRSTTQQELAFTVAPDCIELRIQTFDGEVIVLGGHWRWTA